MPDQNETQTPSRFASTGGISPTYANIQSTVNLGTLERAAAYLDTFPEDIAHLSRGQLLEAAANFDKYVANRGPNTFNPFTTGFSQIDFQRAIAEGSDVVAGFDLGDIDPSLLSGSAKDQLRDAGFDPDNEPIDIQYLIDAGVTAGDLKRTFAETLTGLGILDPGLGATKDGRGLNFSQTNIDKIRNGLIPEQREIREQLATRAADLAGSLDPDAFVNDPLVRAALQTNSQGVRGAYSSRGLNNSGVAAFSESASGIQLLEGLRQSREQEALGLLDVSSNLALGGPLGVTSAGILDKVFQQNTGVDVLNLQRQQATEAASILRDSSSFYELFKTNFAGSFGGSLGTLAGVGGLLGGNSFSSNNTQTGQQSGGSGLVGTLGAIFA